MATASTILGHTAQLAALQSDLQTGNVSHAYLFAGPPHVGKFTIAKWFASQLLTADDASPEQSARKRHMIDHLIHPDLLVLDKLWMDDQMDDFVELAKYSNVPQDHRKKAKAKTDTIGIDDVRALQERLVETGTGRYRCCLIRKIERMQDEAVNALLKIVEEPPEGVVFLLTTEQESGLLPTIVSRARVLHFSRLSREELESLVHGMDAQTASFLLQRAQGAPGVIVSLKGDADLLRKEREMHTQAAAFWHSRKALERLKLLSPLEKRGPDAENLALHLALTLRSDAATLPPAYGAAFFTLLRGLESNASRPLLLQRFVLALEK